MVDVQGTYLNDLLNKEIEITFTSGERYIGILKGHDKYTLLLEIEVDRGFKTVKEKELVYKHDIRRISLA